MRRNKNEWFSNLEKEGSQSLAFTKMATRMAVNNHLHWLCMVMSQNRKCNKCVVTLAIILGTSKGKQNSILLQKQKVYYLGQKKKSIYFPRRTCVTLSYQATESSDSIDKIGLVNSSEALSNSKDLAQLAAEEHG